MSDDFTNHVIKVIIARCAQKFGFIGISETALAIVTEIVIGFVHDTASLAEKTATNAGRVDVNGYDVFYALKNIANYSPEVLTNFIKRKHGKIISYESYIAPYPEPALSSFYKKQIIDKNTNFHPFRTFVPIRSKIDSGDVPVWYDDYPPESLYKKNAISAEKKLSEIDFEKQRSKEQKMLQMQIDNMNRSTDGSKKQTIDIDSHLMLILSSDISQKPDNLPNIDLIMKGQYPNKDPEFSKFSNSAENRYDDDDDEWA